MAEEVRLHIGCGGVHLDGYTNVDLYESEATDEVWPCHMPNQYDNFKPGTVTEVIGFHCFEHFDCRSINALVAAWHRILHPGGKVIMEMPDLYNICRDYVARYGDDSNRKRLDILLHYMYGSKDGPGQDHQWGWDEQQLRSLFGPIGFKVEFTEPQDYHASEAPCLRMEATKL